MNSKDLLRAWGRTLTGRRPSLSIEITRECPLRCPGCYAYEDGHVGDGLNLRQLSDKKGEALIQGVLDLVDQYRPVHLSIVGGDPLVRFRELDILLPKLEQRGLHIQLVTSAFREIPKSWSAIRRLSIAVSIDGLQPEHDARRKPATYERILKNIQGHRITVHCTITAQMMQRPGYLQEFLEFWSAKKEIKRVWMKFLRPPASPDQCVFAQTTMVVSADLKTKITPCQFGGDPDCSHCGCLASMGLAAVGHRRLMPGISVGSILNASLKIGSMVRTLSQTAEPRRMERGQSKDPAGDVLTQISLEKSAPPVVSDSHKYESSTPVSR